MKEGENMSDVRNSTIEQAATVLSTHGEAANGWPKLAPIQEALPPVARFNENLMPASLRSFVCEIAEQFQVPIDYAAVPTVIGVAGAVNLRATIQPKAADTTWAVVPCLSGAVVGPSGFMKSSVIQAAIRPLGKIQGSLQSLNDRELREYEIKKEESDLRRAVWRDQFEDCVRKGVQTPARPEGPLSARMQFRVILKDPTFETLCQTMRQNYWGVLVVRDELTDWWTHLDRLGREHERAFYLQALEGTGGHIVDRIGHDTVYLESC